MTSNTELRLKYIYFILPEILYFVAAFQSAHQEATCIDYNNYEKQYIFLQWWRKKMWRGSNFFLLELSQHVATTVSQVNHPHYWCTSLAPLVLLLLFRSSKYCDEIVFKIPSPFYMLDWILLICICISSPKAKWTSQFKWASFDTNLASFAGLQPLLVNTQTNQNEDKNNKTHWFLKITSSHVKRT